MRLSYDEVDEAFRDELVAWLEVNAPTKEELQSAKKSSSDLPAWAVAWQRRLFDAGYLVPGWPPELGGRNATPTQQMIYFEELARRELPAHHQPAGPRHRRAVDPRLRHRRAEASASSSRRCGPRSRGASA